MVYPLTIHSTGQPLKVSKCFAAVAVDAGLTLDAVAVVVVSVVVVVVVEEWSPRMKW